jgi:molybdenum cofactor biosynthesis protein B
MSYQQHRDSAADTQVRCAVVTLSDTRTPETDTSGVELSQHVKLAGHALIDYRILKDDPAQLTQHLKVLLAREDVDVILTNGGTGISRRDQTIDAIQALIEKPLPGFGELFRLLSYKEIGSGAMLSRATAGITNGKAIFAMPGSTAAVELAMTRLIVPELRHLVHQLRK